MRRRLYSASSGLSAHLTLFLRAALPRSRARFCVLSFSLFISLRALRFFSIKARRLSSRALWRASRRASRSFLFCSRSSSLRSELSSSSSSLLLVSGNSALYCLMSSSMCVLVSSSSARRVPGGGKGQMCLSGCLSTASQQRAGGPELTLYMVGAHISEFGSRLPPSSTLLSCAPLARVLVSLS